MPMTTSSLGYFFSSLARSGSTWMQLMQQYVQKSSTTTLPRRSLSLTGPAVLSQPTPPSSSGALMRFSLGVSEAAWAGKEGVRHGARATRVTRAGNARRHTNQRRGAQALERHG